MAFFSGRKIFFVLLSVLRAGDINARTSDRYGFGRTTKISKINVHPLAIKTIKKLTNKNDYGDGKKNIESLLQTNKH